MYIKFYIFDYFPLTTFPCHFFMCTFPRINTPHITPLKISAEFSHAIIRSMSQLGYFKILVLINISVLNINEHTDFCALESFLWDTS